jgi:hypothetical protein
MEVGFRPGLGFALALAFALSLISPFDHLRSRTSAFRF